MPAKSLRPYLALLLVQILFGLNFPASKVILDQVPPVLWSALRMALAAILMFITAWFVVPKTDRRMDREFLQTCFVYGFFGFVLSQTFFMVGLKHTSSINGAVLNTLIPIFTLLVAIVLRTEKITLNRSVGFLIAFTGVLVLRRFEEFSTNFETVRGDLYMILNGLSLAIFFNLSREFLKKNSAYWVTAWMFLFGAMVIGLFGFEDFSKLQGLELNAPLLGAMLFNVIGATLLTYFINSWTLKQVSASSVAIFIYLQPVIAALYSWGIDHEPPHLRTLLSVGCIFLGVVLGVIPGSNRKPMTEKNQG